MEVLAVVAAAEEVAVADKTREEKYQDLDEHDAQCERCQKARDLVRYGAILETRLNARCAEGRELMLVLMEYLK